jgi:hypothetical protein
MGWTFFTVRESEKTRDILTREFSQREGERSGEWYPAWTVTDLSIIGRTAYAVIRIDKKTGAEWHGRVILFSRKAYDGQGENFGYKDIAEDCFPYYFAAPLSHIEKLDRVAPVDPESNAGKWRAAVRNYHAQRKACSEYSPGLSVKYGGAVYQLIEKLGPRKGWRVVREKSGGVFYRMGLSQLARAEIIN